MRSYYKKLGDYVRPVDERNSDDSLGKDNLYGISVTKEFIVSHANLVDVTFDNYKIVAPRHFAYIPDTSRRGDKIAISLNTTGEKIIVSSICTVFEIINEELLLPEYLMLWFMRPEFDRYARFMSNGSAREVFDWDCMCGVELPVPPLPEQQKIVRDYQVITDRIELLRKMNENLEQIVREQYEKTFASYYNNDKVLPNGWIWKHLGDVCSVKGGKRLPAETEFSETITKHPYIRIRDMYQGIFVELTTEFEYIDDDVFEVLRRYIVDYQDVIIAIVGVTAGEISIIGKTLDKANLTENCVKLTNYDGVTSEYIYAFWQSMRMSGKVDTIIVGAVQPKLPIYNIQNLDIIVPDVQAMAMFQEKASAVSALIQKNIREVEQLRVLKNMVMHKAFAKGA